MVPEQSQSRGFRFRVRVSHPTGADRVSAVTLQIGGESYAAPPSAPADAVHVRIQGISALSDGSVLLANDDGTGWVVPGDAGSRCGTLSDPPAVLSNSRATVRLGDCDVVRYTTATHYLDAYFPLTFNAATFAGTHAVRASCEDRDGQTCPVFEGGSYTVQ